jgi:hypothetical protein
VEGTDIVLYRDARMSNPSGVDMFNRETGVHSYGISIIDPGYFRGSRRGTTHEDLYECSQES